MSSLISPHSHTHQKLWRTQGSFWSPFLLMLCHLRFVNSLSFSHFTNSAACLHSFAFFIYLVISLSTPFSVINFVLLWPFIQLFYSLIVLFLPSTPQLHKHSSGPLCPHYIQVSCLYICADWEQLEMDTVGDCISGCLQSCLKHSLSK